MNEKYNNDNNIDDQINHGTTSRNKSDVTSGEIIVCITTIKNLSTSFLYSVQKPIQLT